MDRLDQVAQQAFRGGHSPKRYQRLALRYADGASALVIVAIVLWFYSTWRWALIPVAGAVVMAFLRLRAMRVADRLKQLYETSNRKPRE